MLRVAWFLLWIALPGNSAAAQGLAYVTDVSSSVSVIDTASNNVVASIAVGDFSFGVAITPDGTRGYVTNSRSNSVSVIDTASNSVVASVAVGNPSFGVAITPDGSRA